jgi:hypothetical protein
MAIASHRDETAAKAGKTEKTRGVTISGEPDKST